MLQYKKTNIRPLTLNDLDNLMSWVNDQEVVGRYAYFTKPFTREQEKIWLKSKIESDVDYFFAIEDQSSQYLGNVAIEKIHWPSRHGSLSITIGNKSERRKGHGYRAINLVLDRAFNQLKLHKVYLLVAEDNKVAKHLYKKCGFLEEGFLIDHYVIDGNFINMHFMRIFDYEFDKLHSSES